MTLQYQGRHTIEGVTNVAFSPKGNYIATSGLDGRRCIWDLENGVLLYLVGISSLVWVPPGEDTLICGLADGSIACIDLNGDFLEAKAVWAHLNVSRLMTVTWWSAQAASCWFRDGTLSAPITWTRVHTLPLHGQIVEASVSTDGKRIAIFNLLRGCDVYSLTSGMRLCTMNQEVLDNHPTSVLWIHHGLALLEGSTAGRYTL